MDKEQIKLLKENWKEAIKTIYNHVGEKILFEELLIEYEPCEEFLEVLQSIILVNENWFTSMISFETKIALLKELLGKDNEVIHHIQPFCEACGSKEFIYDAKEEFQQLIIICKFCGKKIKELGVQSPEF